MLTQTVAGRATYDYDYNVGSRNMGMAIGVAFGAGDIGTSSAVSTNS